MASAEMTAAEFTDRMNDNRTRRMFELRAEYAKEYDFWTKQLGEKFPTAAAILAVAVVDALNK